MLKKAQLRLTFFCLLVTGTVLISLTIVCLIIAEKNLQQNYDILFQNKLYSIISYLETQNNISSDWISMIEENKKILIYIENSDLPLISTTINKSEKDQMLILAAQEHAEENHAFTFQYSTGQYTKHIEFDFTYNKLPFKVSAISMPKNGSNLNGVIIFSFNALNQQIIAQRILLITFMALGIAILAFFSWIFTSRILLPVKDNKIRQNQFIASASHELRTPLMVMISNLDAIEKGSESEKNKFLKNVRSECFKMALLVNDMLLLTRSDNHMLALNIQKIALDTLITSIYEKYENLAYEKKLAFSLILPDELLPEYPCDPLKMEQSISIVVDNALQYSVKGKVDLMLISTSKNLKIVVRDTGPGIPDDIKEHVFERFYRGNTKDYTSTSHFGLGLCIAKEIILKHNGTITIKDTEGGGATFIILLPQNNAFNSIK